MKTLAIFCAFLAVSSAFIAGRKNVRITDDGTILIHSEDGKDIRIAKAFDPIKHEKLIDIKVQGPNGDYLASERIHSNHIVSEDLEDHLVNKVAGEALHDHQIHTQNHLTGASETVAEVAAHQVLKQVDLEGHDPTSHHAHKLALHKVEEALNEADRIGATHGQSYKSQNDQLLAVSAAHHVLNSNGHDTESTFTQALAVAAAQQALDDKLVHGEDVHSITVKHALEQAVEQAIEKIHAGQVNGLGSSVAQALAIDAANRALHYWQHKGLDVSSGVARAIAVAAAQQALDHEQVKGQDISTDVARVIAVAAARDALEKASQSGQLHKIVSTVYGQEHPLMRHYWGPWTGHQSWPVQKQWTGPVQHPWTSQESVIKPWTHQTWSEPWTHQQSWTEQPMWSHHAEPSTHMSSGKYEHPWTVAPVSHHVYGVSGQPWVHGDNTWGSQSGLWNKYDVPTVHHGVAAHHQQYYEVPEVHGRHL